MSLCSVCNRALGDEIMTTSCGHRFHANCINFCVRRYSQCPDCETNITQSDIHRTEGNPPRNDRNTSELQNDIRRLLAEMQANNNRNRSDANIPQDNHRPRYRWNPLNAERNQGTVENHGTIINCNTYQPMTLSFGLSVQPPTMPFMQSLGTPSIGSGPARLMLPEGRRN